MAGKRWLRFGPDVDRNEPGVTTTAARKGDIETHAMAKRWHFVRLNSLLLKDRPQRQKRGNGAHPIGCKDRPFRFTRERHYILGAVDPDRDIGYRVPVAGGGGGGVAIIESVAEHGWLVKTVLPAGAER